MIAVEDNRYVLPPNLPVPIDDGACDHLLGVEMPPLTLYSTRNRLVDVREISQHPAVLFFYPHTGIPGTPIREGWNEIPGARGCTPQSCAFRDHYHEFKELGAEIFGVSAQSLSEQVDFALRNNIPYELLNDSDFRLTTALRLPTFELKSTRYIKRLALVVNRSRIEKVFYPVFPPDKNAETVLTYLKSRTG